MILDRLTIPPSASVLDVVRTIEARLLEAVNDDLDGASAALRAAYDDVAALRQQLEAVIS